MLRWQRPRLFAAASAVPPPQQALAWQAAWQSGLPLAAVQQQQREAVLQQALLALNSSGSGGSGGRSAVSLGRLVESAANAAVLFADGWAQAGLAADGQLSAAVQDCACLGPDGAGQLFWTGQLNGSYPISAVRLLLPIQAGSSSAGGGSSSSSSGGSSQDEGAADNAAGEEAGRADEEAGDSLAPAQAAPAPAPALPPTSGPTAAAAAQVAAAAAGQAAVLGSQLDVEVRIGDSLDHSRNQLCAGQQSLQLGHPQREVQCDVPLPVGRYVTVAVAAAAAQQQQQTQTQQQQQTQLCLCEVQALPAVGPAVSAAAPAASTSGGDASGDGVLSSLPAAPLNLTAAVASQSSEAKAGQGSAASAALSGWPPQLGRQQCSSTGGELAPWW